MLKYPFGCHLFLCAAHTVNNINCLCLWLLYYYMVIFSAYGSFLIYLCVPNNKGRCESFIVFIHTRKSQGVKTFLFFFGGDTTHRNGSLQFKEKGYIRRI